jgi:hypothetical protein
VSVHLLGRTEPRGELHLQVIRGNKAEIQPPNHDITLGEILQFGSPWAKGLSPAMRRWKARNWRDHLFRGVPKVLAARAMGIATVHGSLFLTKIDGRTGQRTDFGLVGLRVVTTAGVNYLAADMNDGASDISAFDYAGLGTGTTAENVTDTALVTELTTEYTGNVRTAGTPSNPSANIYRSACTSTLDSGTPVLREHGLFTASSAGTLWDRTVFAAITLDGTVGDSLLSTYSVTFAAGS